MEVPKDITTRLNGKLGTDCVKLVLLCCTVLLPLVEKAENNTNCDSRMYRIIITFIRLGNHLECLAYGFYC